MFERINAPFQPITLQDVFETNPLQETQEIRDLCRTSRYNFDVGVEYNLYNSRRNSDCVLKRPDITITLNLLKEIALKPISIAYCGKNLQLALNERIFNSTEEELQNIDKNDLLTRILEPQSFTTRASYGQDKHLVITDIIRGQSFLSKFKKLNINKFEGARYTFERLKNLELNLIDSKFDNTMIYKITDLTTEGTIIAVITNNYNWLKLRKIVSQIPEFFPDNIIKELDEELINEKIKLVKLLGSETQDNTAWIQQLTQILNNPKRKEQKILGIIKGIVDSSRNYRETLIKRDINNTKANIGNYEAGIRDYYERLRVLEGKLLRLNEDTDLEQALNEAVEYMKKSKLITDYKFEPQSKRLDVTVDAPIRYFDQEYAKALLRNMTTDTYSQTDDGKIFKQLLHETFVEEKYVLCCSTVFSIFFYDSDGLPISYRINRLSEENIKYIGQPHLNAYECLGNNKIEAQKACKELDLLGLLTVFTTASQNFNLTDSAVFGTFRRTLLSDSRVAKNKKSFLNKETGEFFSFQEYYNKVKYADELEKIRDLRNKYNRELTRAEINYLSKALKALGKLIAPSEIAKQVAIATYNSGSLPLTTTARMNSTYAEATNNEKCIVLTVITENNASSIRKVDAAIGGKEYYELINSYENSDNSEALQKTYREEVYPALYTTLLEEYNSSEVETYEEVPMPF